MARRGRRTSGRREFCRRSGEQAGDPAREDAIRVELEPLRPLVEEGGYILDHRIPPDVSLEEFRNYVRIFKEVFGSDGPGDKRS